MGQLTRTNFGFTVTTVLNNAQCLALPADPPSVLVAPALSDRGYVVIGGTVKRPIGFVPYDDAAGVAGATMYLTDVSDSVSFSDSALLALILTANIGPPDLGKLQYLCPDPVGFLADLTGVNGVADAGVYLKVFNPNDAGNPFDLGGDPLNELTVTLFCAEVPI